MIYYSTHYMSRINIQIGSNSEPNKHPIQLKRHEI
ncbi:hypothetical protein JOJ88_005235 [Pantoea cypripedii]|nr:hypothetical protein [Pantoea cypripedii]